MPYRVETASSARAGCQATECKKAGIKIDKDELRLGTWVEFQERGSWMWRHWGCVSGKILQNIRETIEDPANPGTYRWDYLDGYQGDEKNSLDKHPDLQEKVRRVITQGFIDPEDFNGDAEMNKLGENGLYTAESKRRMREDQKNSTHRIAELEAQLAAVTAERDALRAGGASTSKLDVQLGIVQDALNEQKTSIKSSPVKRKVKAESDGEDGEAKPAAKKKRATKAKKEVDDDGEEVKPAVNKSRAKKVKKEEEDADMSDEGDAEPTPTKKSKGKKIIKKEAEQNDDEEPAAAKPTRNSRAKKAKEDVEMGDEGAKTAKPAPARKSRAKKVANVDEGPDTTTIAAPKRRAGRGKKATKQDEQDEQKVVKEEPSEETAVIAPESSNTGVTEASTANTTLPDESEVAVKGELSEGVNLASGTAETNEGAQDASKTDAEPTAAAIGSQATEVTRDGDEEAESQTKKKGGRAKKGTARSRTASKG